MRNQINREYKDDPDTLTEITRKMADCIPALLERETGARNYYAAKFGLCGSAL